MVIPNEQGNRTNQPRCGKPMVSLGNLDIYIYMYT